MNVTTFQALFDARDAASKVARYQGQWLTWGQLKNDVSALAATLQEQPGAQVGVFCVESYSFAVALLATWRAGKTAWLPGHAGAVDNKKFPVWLTDSVIPTGVAMAHRAEARAFPNHAIIVATSGSTGEPKEVPKTFEQIESEVAMQERVHGEQLQGAVVLGTVSHQHLYGFLFRVAWPLLAGRPFVSESTLFPTECFGETARLDSVAWVSSPAFLSRVPADSDWQSVRGRVRAVFSSGGLLPPAARKHTSEGAQAPVIEIFGSTETGGVASRSTDGLWRALPGVALSQRDGGALAVKSPYAGGDEWLEMADAVELKGDSFQLLGRLDRIVKIEEKRVSLIEVEQALASSSLVREAHAVMLSSGGRQSVGAVVVPSADGARLEKHALVSRLREALKHIEPLAMPRRWRFVDAAPRNSMGKVTRGELVALFEEARAGTVNGTRLPVVESVQVTSDTAVELTLSITRALAAFEGHFDAVSILPGVAQVHYAVQLGRAHFKLPGHAFSAMEAVKFQRVIQPGASVRLSLRWDAVKQKLYFTYSSATGVCSSGRIVLKDAAA